MDTLQLTITNVPESTLQLTIMDTSKLTITNVQNSTLQLTIMDTSKLTIIDFGGDDFNGILFEMSDGDSDNELTSGWRDVVI